MNWVRKKVYLLISLALTLFIPACSLMDGKSSPTAPDTQNSLTAFDGSGPHRSFPSACFNIYVPWMSQMPPKLAADSDGTAWQKTNNCGQAICVMLGAKFNGGALASWVIDSENNWLGCSTPYGCTTGAATLQRLLNGFHALNSTIYTGNYADDVVMEGYHGRPVIVAVRTNMSPPGVGRPHWMLFTGWDGTYMYFNDPGKSAESDGRSHCTVSQFMTSWNDQGRVYIPVYR